MKRLITEKENRSYIWNNTFSNKILHNNTISMSRAANFKIFHLNLSGEKYCVCLFLKGFKWLTIAVNIKH